MNRCCGSGVKSLLVTTSISNRATPQVLATPFPSQPPASVPVEAAKVIPSAGPAAHVGNLHGVTALTAASMWGASQQLDGHSLFLPSVTLSFKYINK